MSTSKIWLSKVYESPKGVLFWLKALGLLLLIIFLSAELISLFALGWSDFQPIFALEDLLNSFIVSIGSITLSCALGIPLAFLISNYRFPGYKIFPWIFLFPIALPSYAFAFTYGSLLGYTGPWQNFLQSLLGPQTTKALLFSTKTTFWVAVWTGLSTFPYVYIFFYHSFKKHIFFYLEIAKSLKPNNLNIFKTVVLPLAKPLLLSTISLLFIISLNEYGASKYSGISTITTKLIDAFLNPENGTGTNLKKWMATLGGLLALFYIGKAMLIKSKQQIPALKQVTIERTQTTLNKKKAITALLLCTTLCLISTIVPMTELVRLLLASVSLSKFIPLSFNTIILAIVTLALVVLLRSIYSVLTPKLLAEDKLGKVMHLTNRFFINLPGFLLGFTVIILVRDFNGMFNWSLETVGNKSTPLQLLALVIGCTIYLLAFSIHFSQLEFSNFSPVQKSWITSNSSFLNHLKSTWSFDRSAIMLAILFIECTKELPINLMSQYNPFPTLAGYGFNLACSDLLTSSASVVFLLLIINTLPFLVLIKKLKS